MGTFDDDFEDAEEVFSDDTAPDALSLLREDHTRVTDLFEAYEAAVDGAHDDRKPALAQKICALLGLHAQLEEEIFYPAVRDAIEEQNLVDEAEVEHASARDLIEQIETMGPGDALYDAKVKVLGEYVKHHIREEEDALFPAVELSELDLQELGTELQERKKELEEELGLEFAS
jgi:hemerythrin-like domain-containing protein